MSVFSSAQAEMPAETRPQCASGHFGEVYCRHAGGRLWPVSDRERQSRSPTSVTLDFRLFRDLQCVIDVDAEVPDSAFQLAVPEQQLHYPQQVLSPAVNQRRLRPPHCVRSVGCWIESYRLYPTVNDSCVLACG